MSLQGIKSVRNQSDNSFASLDFLRGLSAATVLISHTSNFISSEKPLLPFYWGSFAVDIFMLISGFLMLWHFYERRSVGETWGTSKTCMRFYLRRFFRIAPLYYCMLIIVYLFNDSLRHCVEQDQINLHYAPGLGPGAPPGNITLGQILSHFSFAFGLIPSFAASNMLPDWSIGLEMQFYLFFPFLALLLVRSQFVGGVLLLLALNWVSLKVFSGVFPMPSFLPLKINCFLVGMLLAAGLYEKVNIAKRTFLLLLALVIAGFYMQKFLLACFLFAFYELAITCGTGLPGIDKTMNQVRRLIGHKVFKFAADTSYGVYLIHIPLLVLVLRLMPAVCPFAELSAFKRFLLCLTLILPLVYALAFLAHKYIETPGISLGRKLVKRIR
jgi:peptidoglycan/LPS O-acetylase OafA/YrhL